MAFEEYSGGGFFDRESWYEIELAHLPGRRVVRVDRRLRFTASGRTELRFWSDNFYPAAGITPMGCYTLRLTFYFTASGGAVSVSTGTFKMDV